MTEIDCGPFLGRKMTLRKLRYANDVFQMISLTRELKKAGKNLRTNRKIRLPCPVGPLAEADEIVLMAFCNSPL